MKKTVALILALVLIAMCLSIGAGAALPPVVFGDANNDGKITINDVTDIQRLLAELTEDPSGTVARRCNVDGEALSVTDVTAIQRYLAEFEHDPYHIGSEARDFGSETDENALPFVPD